MSTLPPRPAPLGWLVALILATVGGCVACSRESARPAAEAAPVVAPSADTDDCPGGMCTIPVRRK